MVGCSPGPVFLWPVPCSRSQTQPHTPVQGGQAVLSGVDSQVTFLWGFLSFLGSAAIQNTNPFSCPCDLIHLTFKAFWKLVISPASLRPQHDVDTRVNINGEEQKSCRLLCSYIDSNVCLVFAMYVQYL